MTCAILIPSLNRPHRLEATVLNIREVTPEPHKMLFCVADDESKAILDRLGEWYLDDADDPDRRYVTRMNKLVRHIGDADTVFFGSDDVIHHKGWLKEALKVLHHGVSVVVVNDMHNPSGTQALVRADYLQYAVVDSPGDAFYGGYHHNFADNEQSFTAWKRGTYARAMLSVVEHLHPVFQSPNSVNWDDTYQQALDGWDGDAALFANRRAFIEEVLR